MANPQQSEALDGGGIRFTPDYLVEIEQDRLIHRIQRPEVVRITLRWGLVAPRPTIQAAVGVSCLLGSVYFLTDTIRGFMASGSRSVGRVLIVIIFLSVIGGWAFVEAWRKGYYLEVQTKKGLEKRRFDRKASREEIEAFLGAVQSKLGWIIGNTIMEDLERP